MKFNVARPLIGWIVIATPLAYSALFTSCSAIFPPHEEEITTVEKVALYYLKDEAKSDNNGAIDAYFDFSNGMNFAYASDTTKNILRSLVNKISSYNTTKIYSLRDDSIMVLPDRQTTLYNTIMSSEAYGHQYAPIEKALATIAENNRNALLVTDFEEYTPDGVVQRAAFATRYFEKWLRRGGDITFYVTNYLEGKLPKHLYYIVFSKRDHQLLQRVEDALKGQPINYQTYLLSSTPCTMSTGYIGAAYGGNYMDNEGDDPVSTTLHEGDTNNAGESFYNFNIAGSVFKDSKVFRDAPLIPVEYYPFGANWEDIAENARAMSEPGVIPPFTHLLRHLYANLSHTDSYTVTGMKLVVTDVQADMDTYANNLLARFHKPMMISDGAGGQVADFSQDPLAENYYDNQGNLLPHSQYDPANPRGISQIMDLLELDQKLFAKTYSETPDKVEIGIKFCDGASGKVEGYTPGEMLRLDIVIAQCEPSIERLDELFSWPGNTNLRDAIRGTLQELNPVGRVVYSYFVKTTE